MEQRIVFLLLYKLRISEVCSTDFDIIICSKFRLIVFQSLTPANSRREDDVVQDQNLINDQLANFLIDNIEDRISMDSSFQGSARVSCAV